MLFSSGMSRKLLLWLNRLKPVSDSDSSDYLDNLDWLDHLDLGEGPVSSNSGETIIIIIGSVSIIITISIIIIIIIITILWVWSPAAASENMPRRRVPVLHYYY